MIKPTLISCPCRILSSEKRLHRMSPKKLFLASLFLGFLTACGETEYERCIDVETNGAVQRLYSTPSSRLADSIEANINGLLKISEFAHPFMGTEDYMGEAYELGEKKAIEEGLASAVTIVRQLDSHEDDMMLDSSKDYKAYAQRRTDCVDAYSLKNDDSLENLLAADRAFFTCTVGSLRELAQVEYQAVEDDFGPPEEVAQRVCNSRGLYK